MTRILVTGGPVHAKIDAIKIVTNNFRGGRMVQLAEELAGAGNDVSWMSPGEIMSEQPSRTDIQTIDHSGFHDYQEKIKTLAPDYDAIVFGAAVANLIPIALYKSFCVVGGRYELDDEQTIDGNLIPLPLEGKFPSHDYEPGEPFFMQWAVAPRVINDVHKVSPKTHVFGFKLLAGVPLEELIDAAYDIVLDAHATCVFANLREDLDIVYAVMKDRSVHKMPRSQVSSWIEALVADKYYRTELIANLRPAPALIEEAKALIDRFSTKFIDGPRGLVFGTVAVRDPDRNNAFVTTARGKNEVKEFSYVDTVFHRTRQVVSGMAKATLNAPLLHHIFKTNPDVKRIVHWHGYEEDWTDIPILPYAPSGTVRDSMRDVDESFIVEGHGTYILESDE